MATSSPLSILEATDIMPVGGNSSSCAMFNGQQHLCDTIIGVKRFISIVSMLACLATVVFIWLFRKYLIFIQRLILYLSVAAFFESVFFFTGDKYEAGPLCTFQAWALSFFAWAVLIWNCCIIFNLYMTAIRSTQTDKFEWLYHFVSWVVSFVIACLPLIGNQYGPAGMWCWIKDNWGWRFGTFYLPLIVSLAGMLIAYIYISVTVNRQSRTWEGLYDPDTERKKQLLREDLKPLRWYPVAYLATSLFPFANRVQNAINSQPVFTLTLLQAMSNPLYGFILGAIFFADREVWSQLTMARIKGAFNAHRQRDANMIREYPAIAGTGSLAANPAGDPSTT